MNTNDILTITALTVWLIIVTVMVNTKLKIGDKAKIIVIDLIIILSILIFFAVANQVDQSTPLREKDPLNKNVLFIPGIERGFSSWPISHFILYLILGYTFPKEWPFLLVVGIVWEFIEVSIGKAEDKIFGKNKDITKISDVQYENNWCTGDFADIAFNITGMIAGIAIRTVVDKTRGG